MRHPILEDPLPNPLILWWLSNWNPLSCTNAHEGWLEFESGSCPGNPKGPRVKTGVQVLIQDQIMQVMASVETLQSLIYNIIWWKVLEFKQNLYNFAPNIDYTEI